MIQEDRTDDTEEMTPVSIQIAFLGLLVVLALIAGLIAVWMPA